MCHFFLCAAATNYKHSWGATWSDQAQSRWANLRQDEEWPRAQRPTSCESCAGFCCCCCCFFVVWVLQVWPWLLGRLFKNKHFNFFWSVFVLFYFALLFVLVCPRLTISTWTWSLVMWRRLWRQWRSMRRLMKNSTRCHIIFIPVPLPFWFKVLVVYCGIDLSWTCFIF